MRCRVGKISLTIYANCRCLMTQVVMLPCNLLVFFQRLKRVTKKSLIKILCECLRGNTISLDRPFPGVSFSNFPLKTTFTIQFNTTCFPRAQKQSHKYLYIIFLTGCFSFLIWLKRKSLNLILARGGCWCCCCFNFYYFFRSIKKHYCFYYLTRRAFLSRWI